MNSGGFEIFYTGSDRTLGPPNLLYDGNIVSFSWEKRPGRDLDHPHASSAEVKRKSRAHLLGYLSGSLPCWTGERVGVRRRETPKTDAGSSVISSDLKHRANDARDGSSSYSNRRDQSGLNGCCTAMWKANGKTTTLSLFLDSLFPETEIPCMRDAWRQERILSFEGESSRSH